MIDDLERAEERVGRVLNEKWMLEGLLGLGGMAAVYRARHRNGARAAVKLLHADLSRNADIRRRFVHEAKAANRVEHPGAVSIIDDDVVRDGPDAGAAYLVMELLEGQPLSTRAEALGGRMSEPELLAVVKQVLDVLEAAHAKGIVHRDLKPDNIFLVRDPTVEAATPFPWTRAKILDFGVARARDDGDSHMTKTGAMLGTPAYMSPEQALGRQSEIDGRTDLYALGATMFRLLTGKKVHESSNSNEAMIKVATVPARSVRSVAHEVSPAVAEIIDRALKFSRDERYPNAAAMREDVKAAMAGAPLPSYTPASMRGASAPFLAAVAAEPTVGAQQPVVAIAATIQREPPPVLSARPKPKPKVALFAALGGAFLLLVIFGVTYVCWPSPKDESEQAEEKRQPRKPSEPEPEPELSAPAAEEPSAAAPAPTPKPAATPTTTAKKKPIFESDGKGGWKKKTN